jgi:hypothetical protein
MEAYDYIKRAYVHFKTCALSSASICQPLIYQRHNKPATVSVYCAPLLQSTVASTGKQCPRQGGPRDPEPRGHSYTE